MADKFKLTKKQDEANKLLGSGAKHIMLFGGSRSGKTFLLCRAIAIRAMRAPMSRHAIMRLRFNAAKVSIWYDTFPKMMSLCFPKIRYTPNKADWFWEFDDNGAQVWVGGLDDKERTEKVLGQEYATGFLNECSQISYSAQQLFLTRVAQKVGDLQPRMYYDENPPRVTHWTYRLFVSKVDPEPPNRRLPDADDYASLLMNPIDNKVNLPPSYLETLQRLNPRARLRFWEGKFGSAQEGVLWSQETIERHRVEKAPVTMVRVVVAVDPSGTRGEEDERSDAVGIVVAGVGIDGHGYVLEDLTTKGGPAIWGRVAVTAWQRHMADAVVGETNYGGDMVSFVVQTAANELKVTVPFIKVTATRGKAVRAEPAATLYEQGRVHHVGVFPELEDQLCDFTSAGFMGDRSPDRADALVWALADLFPSIIRMPIDRTPAAVAPIPEPDPLAGW